MEKYIKELHYRLKSIIENNCNSIGCANCDLKWENGCSAIDLQSKIID